MKQSDTDQDNDQESTKVRLWNFSLKHTPSVFTYIT